MGLIKKFFSPLTDFLKFYKGMTQGTPEELERITRLVDRNEALKRQQKEIQTEVASAQSSMMDLLSSKVRQIQDMKLKMSSHSAQMEDLVQRMGDSNSDKEAIFNELQQMGFSFDDPSKALPRDQELFDQVAAMGKVDRVVDLRGIKVRTKEFAENTSGLQTDINDFQETLHKSPSIQAYEAISDTSASVLRSVVGSKAVKEAAKAVKAKLSKKPL